MGRGGLRESIFHDDDDDDRYKAVLVEGVKANATLPSERRGASRRLGKRKAERVILSRFAH
jgi:hypothetical protein